MKHPRLSIIIPAYQEARRIEATLDTLAAYLGETGHQNDTEIVVSVATSPDGTAGLARGKAKLFKQLRAIDAGPQVGKGRDVRVGVMEATGDYKVFMDADLATPLHHLEAVRAFMEHNGQVGIGVRDLDQIHTGIRKVISEGINVLVRLLLLPGIRDTQCGFKVFRSDVAEELFGRQTVLQWLFDIELLVIARQLRYEITQWHIDDWQDMPDGTFSGRIWLDSLRTVRDLLLIGWKRLVGRYKYKTFQYERTQ